MDGADNRDTTGKYHGARKSPHEPALSGDNGTSAPEAAVTSKF
jgi:hypothetical protein